MVPKLRFAGFCDKWISSRLSDAGVQIIDGDRGSNYPSSGDFRPTGFCLFLNTGNVTRDGFRFDDVVFITEKKDSELRKGKLQRRDIVLTTRGTIGNTAIYNNQVSFENVRINSGMVLVRTKQTLMPDFLYLYFNSGYFNSWLNKVAFGSAQPQLTVKIINALSIYFPGKSEQTKIADFLSSVDEKITLLTKQYNLLCQYKKCMMQKIFSREFRFKDENREEFPEWEPKHLSEIAIVNPKNKAIPSKFIYIDLESVEKGKLLKEQLISKDDAPSRAQRLLTHGDVLFQLVRPYQKNNYIFLLDGDYVASTGYAQLRAKYNSSFLYQLLHLESFTYEVMNRCTGTSYPAINSSDLASIEVEIPCEKEQTKIANFLSALDDKIAVKKAELDKLKTWKQGLLQQMFV
ncbi:restriction endonuclease subunit S [Klebsiella pneumoniae]|uniref:restriction endonuclease subunit S n=1 Tax=Klebsiella pneumoniae TaxID=573 RepID=UPI0038D3ED7E